MKSLIIQLEDSQLKDRDYIDEDFLNSDEKFISEIADYVYFNQKADKSSEIDWFLERLEKGDYSYDQEEKSIIFNKGFKESFFEERFNKLKEIVNELSLSQFSGSSIDFMLNSIYTIQWCVERKYDMYIASNASGWSSIDSFVREDLIEGKKYFIGSTLVYSF